MEKNNDQKANKNSNENKNPHTEKQPINIEEEINNSNLNIDLDKSQMTFDNPINPRYSVNRLSLEEEEKSIISESDYLYQRRRAEPDISNINFIRTDKFNKVIIPYNFEKKKYEIKYKDIEFYESKDYLIDKLEEYNKNPSFDIEKTYTPKNCFERIKIYFPITFIMIILLYAGFIFTLLSSFNPIVIYTLYSYIKKAYNSLNMFKFILLEKFKMNNLTEIIKKENRSKTCINKKITWKIGRSGYWMEVQKNVL